MNIPLEQLLTEELVVAVERRYGKKLDAAQLVLQPTGKEHNGDFTLICFALSKLLGGSPEQIAGSIGEEVLKSSAYISGFNVIKGFLNLEIKDSCWLEVFHQVLRQPGFGQLPAKGESIMVEYSSPNTNKPLHLGHLRNNFLGHSLALILEAAGHKVVKVNLVNDRGIHICKSMVAYEMDPAQPSPSADRKGDHLVGDYYVAFDRHYKAQVAALVSNGLSQEQAEQQAPVMLQAQELLRKWEAGDPKTLDLWRKMNGWVYDGFQVTYEAIGVAFDHTYYESNTYLLGKDIIEEGLQKGVFFRKADGSVWIDLKEEKLDEKLVLRSDGTSVYITQDLGTADLKFSDFHCNRSIYVVGNEQDYHFKVLFAILKKLGRPYADGLYHMSYGMVELPAGRMKSREGTVVDADDLVAEMIQTAATHTIELGKTEGMPEEEAQKLYRMLGLGALKYFLLKVDPKKKMLFNPEESVQFQGHTGPFIQYTHARICSIVRRGQMESIEYNQPIEQLNVPLLASERGLLALIYRYPDALAQAAKEYSPALLANYAFDLAKEYNRWYAEAPIFQGENKSLIQFRVKLSALTGQTIRRAMQLLGIEVPERM
jgi:arginyl-tRNA synthetase